MDFQVTSTGRIFYQVDPTLAAVLMEAFPESFKRIEKPAPAALSTGWEYTCALLPGGGCFAVQRKTTRETQYCPFADPEKVLAFWSDCPASVIEQFRATRVEERIQQSFVQKI